MAFSEKSFYRVSIGPSVEKAAFMSYRKAHRRLAAWVLTLFVGVCGLAGQLRAQDEKFFSALGFDQINEYRSRLHKWDRLVRGFRKEHSVILATGVEDRRWSLDDQARITDQPFSTRTVRSVFTYNFHIQIHKGFGYYLGTSLGVSQGEKGKRPGGEPFKVGRSLSLPGVQAGLVQNFNPGMRMLLGLDAHLERMEALATRVPGDRQESIYVTTRALGALWAAEFFLKLDTALRLEAGWSRLYYTAPENIIGTAPLDIGLTRIDRRVALGMVYHFL